MTEDFVRDAAEDQRGDASTTMRAHCDEIASILNGSFDNGFVYLIASELHSVACAPW